MINTTILAALGTLSGITVVLLIWFTYIRVIPYLYTNARLGARSKYLLSEKELQSLLNQKDISQLSKKISQKTQTLEELHKTIEQKFLDELQEIRSFTNIKSLPLLDTFETIYESRLLKKLIRKKFNKTNKEETIQNVGIIDFAIIEKINKAKTLADITVILAGTKFAEGFNPIPESIEQMEKQLDKFVTENTLKRIQQSKIYDKKILLDFFQTKNEVMQIIQIIKQIIREEKNIQFPKFIKKSEDISQLVKNLAHTNYKKVMIQAEEKFKKDGLLIHFELALKKHLIDIIKKNEIQYFQGTMPILSYISKIENQKNNLMLISKSVDSGNKNMAGMLI